MNDMKTTAELVAAYESARSAAKAAEEANRSAATQNRKWRAVFAAEDAMKRAGLMGWS
jgi:hypothetical protein